MTPEPGSKWRHKRNGHPYRVVETIQIKIGDAWIQNGVVIYRNDRRKFARLTPDFLESFEEVTE